MHGFSFSTNVRVRFAETDAQGIAHNSNYLIWFEVTRVEYLERHAGGWLHAKLFLVVLAIGYHHACRSLLRKFEQFENQRSERWFRVFNEAAVLIFMAIVVLVVVKPF